MSDFNYAASTLPIDCSSATANEIVPAIAGKIIRVLGFHMMAAGTVNPRWRSGAATSKSGAYPLIANTGVSPAYNPRGVILCGRGEALNLVLDQAVQVSGGISFEYID